MYGTIVHGKATADSTKYFPLMLLAYAGTDRKRLLGFGF